jgi:hypothetical protein
MMAHRSDIRAQVMAQIEDVILAARAAGEGEFASLDTARRTFPGTPDMIFIEAANNIDIRHREEWWQAVERTIDAEIVRTAVLKAGTAS